MDPALSDGEAMPYNSLPDRELTFDEFQELQRSDAFDQVMTAETPGPYTDVLILESDDEETILEYSDEQGWHEVEGHTEVE